VGQGRTTVVPHPPSAEGRRTSSSRLPAGSLSSPTAMAMASRVALACPLMSLFRADAMSCLLPGGRRRCDQFPGLSCEQGRGWERKCWASVVDAAGSHIVGESARRTRTARDSSVVVVVAVKVTDPGGRFPGRVALRTRVEAADSRVCPWGLLIAGRPLRRCSGCGARSRRVTAGTLYGCKPLRLVAHDQCPYTRQPSRSVAWPARVRLCA
jgi:hypothetical protein